MKTVTTDNNALKKITLKNYATRYEIVIHNSIRNSLIQWQQSMDKERSLIE